MSLYNMLFGVNQRTPILLATLGLTTSDVPRFRDCYVKDGRIVIYTRTGGGNRRYYDSEESCRENYPEDFDVDSGNEIPDGPWNSTLTSNPFYERDEDDDFDCTYASFYFRFPDKFRDDLLALEACVQTHTPTDRWKALLESLESTKEVPNG